VEGRTRTVTPEGKVLVELVLGKGLRLSSYSTITKILSRFFFQKRAQEVG